MRTAVRIQSFEKCKLNPFCDSVSPQSEWPSRREQTVKAGGNQRKRIHMLCRRKCCSYYGNHFRSSHKLNTELPYDPNTPPFSIYLKNSANILQRNLHIYVCSSTDHNSQTMGSAKASTGR